MGAIGATCLLSRIRIRMPDHRNRQRVLCASFVTLLVTVAAVAANDDLVNAAKDQNWPQVRTLLARQDRKSTRLNSSH